ncbi:MAG: hypothetical protein ACI3XJ_03600 [Oscillospiraceae bacterium]
MLNEQKYTLFAGAGSAAISFPESAFPTLGENYTGVHDDPHVRVLILKSGDTSFALANFELVSVNDDVDAFKRLISAGAGVPEENVWVCVTHCLETPHLFRPAADAPEADRVRFDILHETVVNALQAALEQAAGSLREARFAAGAGTCRINVNRNISTDKGMWLGSGDHAPADPSVLVYKFEDVSGGTIAVLFPYNAQCSVMDGSKTSTGERLVCGDLSGSATAFVEREFGGDTVAMYLLGAGGDQAPGLKALRTVRGKGGIARTADLHEAGYLLVELLGERLGQEVVRVAESLVCRELTAPLKCAHRSFAYSGQVIPDMRSIRPCRSYDFLPAEDVTTPVEVLQIGDAAIVGVKPELCVRTEMELKARSPYERTGLMTFVNGGAKYMPERDMYDSITFQAMNSRFAKGSAEQFLEDILNLLNEVKAE